MSNLNITKSKFDAAWAPKPKFEPFTGESAGVCHRRLNGKTSMYGAMIGGVRYDITALINANEQEFSIDMTIAQEDKVECISYWIQEELHTGKILGAHPKERPSKESMATTLKDAKEFQLYALQKGSMREWKSNAPNALVGLKQLIRTPLVTNFKKRADALQKLIDEQMQDSKTDNCVSLGHAPLKPEHLEIPDKDKDN